MLCVEHQQIEAVRLVVATKSLLLCLESSQLIAIIRLRAQLAELIQHSVPLAMCTHV